jgi:hypothetical protein
MARRRVGWSHLALRQLMLVSVLGTVTVVGAGMTSTARTSAIALYHFVGTVTDPLGHALEGAYVSDGGQVAVTDANGRFSLPENSPGTYTLTAARPNSAQSSETVTVLTPADTTVDFSLLYLVAGQLSPYEISTANGPASATLSVTSYAPTSGSCVKVTDASGNASDATYLGPAASGGASAWDWTLTLPRDTAEGTYLVDFEAVDCATNTVMSTQGSAQYWVDNTAPIISGPGPTGWTTATPLIQATASDDNLWLQAVTITLDGKDVPATYRWSGSGNAWVFSYQVPTNAPLVAGSHSATLDAIDTAGNASQLAWTFTVDDSPPAISDPVPAGTTTSRTPTLSAHLGDSDSGINASSITMALSNGLVSRQVAATYDASTGIVSYQVPSIPTGVGLGQFPLPDGTYQVTVAVTDLAGNYSKYSWSFTVSTLPSGA